MQRVRVVVAASAVGIACSAALSGVSAQATGSLTAPTFKVTLAGPSQAPMYPSGLIYAPVWQGTTGGAVVVADTGYNRISVFDPTKCTNPATVCIPILQFGTLGSGSGQLNTPRDVAVDGADNVYVADAANSRIQAFTDTGAPLGGDWPPLGAGGPGKLASNLNVPIGLSYDATTNEILVADTGHSLIKAYAAAGGAEGFTAGSYIWKSPSAILKSPREARRGPDGEIWVADYHNEEVKAFQCTCTTSSTSWNPTPNKVIGDGLAGGHNNGELNSPYNIAFSPNNSIAYVSDTGNERIGVFNITTCTETLGSVTNECPFLHNYGARCPKVCPPPPGNAGFFNALRRVAVDPAGNIWAADFWGSGIHEFTSAGLTGSANGMTEIDGNPAPAPGFAEAYGIAVGPTSGGWLAYGVDRLNQRVEEFNNAAPPTNLASVEGKRGTAVGDYSWPETSAVATDGTVWIGDTRNNRLEHFSANLATPPLSVVTGNSTVGAFNYIEGITVAEATGMVWIADTDNNRIVSYNPADGAMVAYGTRGRSVTPPLQFINPQGIAVSSTAVYVADTGNNRIDEVSLTGTLIATYSTGMSAPQDVALAPDGTIWVADTGTSSSDTTGNKIVHLSSSLANLNDGFGSAGTGSSQFDLPHSLAVSPDGSTLFVADTYNNRVQEYNITGS
jgi:tripartite motif-containing protein 71